MMNTGALLTNRLVHLLKIFVFILLAAGINTTVFAQQKLLFLVAGQSNAVGQGDSSLTVKTGLSQAFEYRYTDDSLLQLADPVGTRELDFEKAFTGSAWPAFAQRLYQLTSKSIVIIPAARGGSSCN